MLNKGPKEVDTSAALYEYFLISDCRKNVRMRKIKERKGISSDEKQRGEERWGKPHASSKEPKRPEEKKRKKLWYCCTAAVGFRNVFSSHFSTVRLQPFSLSINRPSNIPEQSRAEKRLHPSALISQLFSYWKTGWAVDAELCAVGKLARFIKYRQKKKKRFN